jgi:hypothetical protein
MKGRGNLAGNLVDFEYYRQPKIEPLYFWETIGARPDMNWRRFSDEGKERGLGGRAGSGKIDIWPNGARDHGRGLGAAPAAAGFGPGEVARVGRRGGVRISIAPSGVPGIVT